jgi:site-specific recombinase XerD
MTGTVVVRSVSWQTSPVPTPGTHPDFEPLVESWQLSMAADGYSPRTLRSYANAAHSLAAWLADNAPGVGPLDATRDHIRGWIVHLRDSAAPNTARTWFAGTRHFLRWLVAEGERPDDATAGLKTPPPSEPHTPVLKADDLRALLASCAGASFVDRRDNALIMLLVDSGLRLAEISGLQTGDVDIRDRIAFVVGKGSNRSGPRRRAVPFGVKAARALDRYVRERRRHPFAELPALWLGARGRAGLSADGVDAALKRRAAATGLRVHPHMFRHTWASEFRRAGGEEGDLMVLGGWRSRAMLDRYGRAVADERAQASYRTRSLGDRL